VASARYLSSSRRQPTFLNLERPYPNQPFTVVILGGDRPSFGSPEVTLPGKRICVTGEIEIYRGKPEIVAKDPAQLVVEEEK
jgi:DNA/RNA endonuclease YhcR with UshA esterase domain